MRKVFWLFYFMGLLCRVFFERSEVKLLFVVVRMYVVVVGIGYLVFEFD